MHGLTLGLSLSFENRWCGRELLCSGPAGPGESGRPRRRLQWRAVSVARRGGGVAVRLHLLQEPVDQGVGPFRASLLSCRSPANGPGTRDSPRLWALTPISVLLSTPTYAEVHAVEAGVGGEGRVR